MKTANKASMQVALEKLVCQCVNEWALPCMHARHQLSRSLVCAELGAGQQEGELGFWERGLVQTKQASHPTWG